MVNEWYVTNNLCCIHDYATSGIMKTLSCMKFAVFKAICFIISVEL